MALYPPILASSQNAFIASTKPQSIYFTLSNMTKLQNIGNVQLKIVYQSNNKSAANTRDGIIYKRGEDITPQGGDLYSIEIQIGDLSNGWVPNKYYKVQIAFGSESVWSSYPIQDSTFTNWKSNQTNKVNVTAEVSEWSTVMILKAINLPTIRIANQDAIRSEMVDDNSSILTELTTTPLFRGKFACEGEPEDKFKFDIYKDDELIESSDWQQHDSVGGLDTWRFKHVLIDFQTYKVYYQVRTVNNYESDTAEYKFLVNENFLTKLEGVRLIVEDSNNEEQPYADENGILNVFLSTEESLSGNYVLSRSSEKSGYTIWEDLKYFVFSNKQFNKDLVYQDFTIESGVKYKYAFQQENSSGLRTSPIYESTSLESSPARLANFEHRYLFNDGVQLKLMFDNKMSSFKHTALANKQDTLGGRYPTINRNGDAYYAEFPITGLISLHQDQDSTFFKAAADGYYFKGEKLIDSSKFPEGDVNAFDFNLTSNNYFIERIFREKVEEFLNDGGYKLYKSATEGNIIVTLMNISLTPNETLGRLVFSFSATAYEVLENTVDNMNEYGIINIGEFQKAISGRDGAHTLLLGQLSGLFDTSDNLVTLIKEQNEYNIGGGYQYKFERLASIQIGAFPEIDFKDELNELHGKLIQAINDKDEQERVLLQEKINTITALRDAAMKQVEYPIVTVYINNKEVSLSANRIYQLREDEIINSIYLKYKEPIIVNYTCYTSSIESQTSTISAITTSTVWGQLAGVFTTTEKILDNYILNRDKNSILVTDKNNYGLYQSLNISEAIKQAARKQIEDRYGTKFIYDETLNQWMSADGKYQYVFQEFVTIDIESDETTAILLTNRQDMVQQRILIGKSNKLRLENCDAIFTDLAFEKPSFAIINYRCMTMQLVMG